MALTRSLHTSPGGTRRLRRLLVIQVAAVAVVFAAVLAIVAYGSVVGRNQETRALAITTATFELTDTFDELRTIQARFAVDRGIRTDGAIGVLQSRARMEAVRLNLARTLPGEAALHARGAAALEAMDRLIDRGSPARNPSGIDRQAVDDSMDELDVKARAWIEELLRVTRTDVSQTSSAWRGVVLTFFALLLVVAGVVTVTTRRLLRGWRGVDLELDLVEREREAVRRLAESVSAGVDAEEIARVAAEVAATTLAADGVEVLRGDAALARQELTATNTAAAHGAATMLASVTAGGSQWGALAARWNPNGPVPPDARARLDRLADAVGMALAVRDREAGPSEDRLTGLPNHQAFREELEQRIVLATESGAPLAVAIVDIDGLANVNTGFGHATGDMVLTEVGRRLKLGAGPDDLVARISGEEFAWIIAGARRESAVRAAEAARAAISAEPMGPVGKVTVSVGVATIADALTGPEIMRCAHSALHAAQDTGDTVQRFSARLAPSGENRGRLAQQREFAALRSLARAVDLRDANTQRHSERVAEVSYLLALQLGWPQDRAARLRQAALVHDVGKVGVPDSVLLKPGKLTPQERLVIETHAPLGAQIVSEILDGEQVGWVRSHHERIDGAGYPDGLPGPEIPDGARLMAVADTWDAMTADRPYRSGMDPQRAMAICREVAGAQLCHAGVGALVVLYERGELTRILAEE